MITVDPYPAKVIYLNFEQLEVVTRYRDPQPQVVQNICLIRDQTFTNLDV